MRVGRRGVLGLGVLGVAGCAPVSGPPTTPSQSTASPATTPPSQAAPSTPAPSTVAPSAVTSNQTTPSASPDPTAAVPSREDLVARYGERTARQWGIEVDGVVLRSGADAAVVTLDACGGPNGSGYDEALIDVLRSLSVPATLFLNLRWIDANPTIAEELAADPLFELANHGTAHLPLSVSGAEAYGISGTASVGEVVDEVMGGWERLAALTGSPPLWFRSGTAHVDDVAVQIVQELGQRVVNFDVNADAGATFSASQVSRAMGEAGPGSICIGHFNRPGSGTAGGMASALPRLLDGGLAFARLRDVLP